MNTAPFRSIRPIGCLIALVAAPCVSAQSVSVEVVAPASVSPGETFTASVIASATPSASVHAIAGFALDVEVQTGQSNVDSLASPVFPVMTDGVRTATVTSDSISGMVAGQWANINGSNPDLSTANPVVLCTIEVTVSASATPGETIELVAANAPPAGGVFLYDAGNPLAIIAVPNGAGTALSFIASTTTIAEPCIADVNGDGMLTPADFSAWIAAYNANLPQCDQNSDNICNAFDFTAWIANYNQGC